MTLNQLVTRKTWYMIETFFMIFGIVCFISIIAFIFYLKSKNL